MKTVEEIKTMIKIMTKWIDFDMPEKEKIKGCKEILEWILEDNEDDD